MDFREKHNSFPIKTAKPVSGTQVCNALPLVHELPNLPPWVDVLQTKNLDILIWVG